MLDGAQQRALVRGRGCDRGPWAGRGAGPARGRCRVAAVARRPPVSGPGSRPRCAAGCRPTLAALEAGDIVYLQAAHLVSAVRELDDAGRQRRGGPGAGAGTGADRRRVPAVGGPGGDRGRPGLGGGAAQEGDRGPADRADGPSWTAMESLVGHHAGRHLPGPVGRPDRRRQSRASRLVPSAGLPTRARRAAGRRPGARHAAQRRRRPRRPADHQDRPGHALARRSRRARRSRCRGARAAGRSPRPWCSTCPTLLGLAEHPGEIPGYGPDPGPDGPGDGRRPGLGPLDHRPRHRPAPGPRRHHLPARRTSCGRSSPPGTGSAASPAATSRPPSATATTSSPSPTTARPSASTSDPCAGNTTTPRPTASGNSPTTPTPAPRPGPAHSARPTPRAPTHP